MYFCHLLQKASEYSTDTLPRQPFMRKNHFTVIIPVFNEEENILRLADVLLAFKTKSEVPTDFLIVDDGSTDNSLDLIKEVCKQHDEFHFISLEQNGGLSVAIKAGIDEADSEWLGYIDSDLQTHPDDFIGLLPFAKEYEMVTGIREKRKDKLIKKFSSKFANGFRRLLINDGIKDTGCPLKIVQYQAAKNTPFFKGMHRFWPALIQLGGGRVKQIPVRHFPRMAGTAKYHLLNRVVGPLIDTFAFRWMKKRNILYKIQQRK